MKKVYVKPQFDAIKFQLEDIITASGTEQPVAPENTVTLTSISQSSWQAIDDAMFVS